MATKEDNTPTNTLELRNNIRCVLGYCEVTEHKGCLYESSRNDSQEIDLIMELVAQAVNKAEITMWEKTTKAMMDILQENFQYRLMCGEVRDPDGKIDVMQGFVKYQELEPERKKFSEYLEGLKLELNRDEAPNQEKQNES